MSSELVNNYLLKPLMTPSSEQLENSNETKGNPAVIKRSAAQTKTTSQNIDLTDYLYNILIPQNNVSKATDFDTLISGVNFGDCALVVDTISTAFVLDTKGFNMRGVMPPNNETVIKGSQEGFVENLRTNTSLLRRIINNENLIVESGTVRQYK